MLPSRPGAHRPSTPCTTGLQPCGSLAPLATRASTSGAGILGSRLQRCGSLAPFTTCVVLCTLLARQASTMREPLLPSRQHVTDLSDSRKYTFNDAGALLPSRRQLSPCGFFIILVPSTMREPCSLRDASDLLHPSARALLQRCGSLAPFATSAPDSLANLRSHLNDAGALLPSRHSRLCSIPLWECTSTMREPCSLRDGST